MKKNKMLNSMDQNIFRFLFITTASLLICSISQSQEMVWRKTFDTGGDDFAWDVGSDSFSNVIVTGAIYGGVNNYYDWFTIKYNKDGDTVWTRRFDNSSYDEAYGIAADQSGNIIVTGKTHTDSTGDDYCTVKYSPHGDIIWVRTLSTDSFGVGEAHAVAVDSKGNIIVTGTSQFPPAETSSPDYVTIKYDSSGTLLWMRVYNFAYEDIAQNVVIDDYDNIIVTGYSTDSSQSYNWDWCTVKYNANGDTLWVRRYDVSNDDRAYAVAVDRAGNVFVGGGASTSVILKYNANGDTVWSKIYSGINLCRDIVINDSGEIFIAAWAGSAGYRVAKCNSTGDTIWTVPCEGQLAGIALDKANSVVVTGSTRGIDGQFDYLTVKYGDVTSVYSQDYDPTLPCGFSLLQNYPNPFNPITKINYTLREAGKVSLKIYNMLGQEVRHLVDEYQSAGEKSVNFDAADLPSGVYFYQLNVGNHTEVKKMIVTK